MLARPLNDNYRNLTYLGFLGYLFVGAAAVLMPSVMPLLTSEYMGRGLTVAAIGLIFPARAVGGILGNLLSGVGADRLGHTRMVWIAALALFVALTLAATVRPWLLFLSAFAAVGLAQGGISTGVNAMIADANADARARALNSLHAIYGLGAALSPLLIGLLLERGLPWRWALAGTALIWLIYGLLARRLDAPQIADPMEDQPEKRVDLTMLRTGPFAALAAIAFIYNGVALSLLGWIALFMQESSGFSLFASISTVSIFYAGLTIGRFLCAAVAEALGYARLLLLLAAGIAATYPLVVLSGNPLVVMFGVFLTGLSLSGLFPMVMAYGSRLYPEQTGTLSGTLNVAMTLGTMVPPLWTGFLAESWGFQWALGVNYLMVVALLWIVFYLRRVEQSPI